MTTATEPQLQSREIARPVALRPRKLATERDPRTELALRLNGAMAEDRFATDGYRDHGTPFEEGKDIRSSGTATLGHLSMCVRSGWPALRATLAAEGRTTTDIDSIKTELLSYFETCPSETVDATLASFFTDEEVATATPTADVAIATPAQPVTATRSTEGGYWSGDNDDSSADEDADRRLAALSLAGSASRRIADAGVGLVGVDADSDDNDGAPLVESVTAKDGVLREVTVRRVTHRRVAAEDEWVPTHSDPRTLLLRVDVGGEVLTALFDGARHTFADVRALAAAHAWRECGRTVDPDKLAVVLQRTGAVMKADAAVGSAALEHDLLLCKSKDE
eukprot:TRINITY_DN1539_c0_g1_i1.p1 TRINITY_DN1539_c0_g1~~TRINITY_DN1539_c0_g1_i1.p1  ORF type:complete len:336 (-),score=68.46 TRINITY_DN1539_c0_g1_i1:74-1081(-)